MRQSVSVVIVMSGVLLAGAPSFAQVGTSPDNPTYVIPDGRINGGISLSEGTYYFRVPTTPGNSYSLEVVDAVTARSAGTVALSLAMYVDGAGGAKAARDTHLLDPGVGPFNARVSWRASAGLTGAGESGDTLTLVVPAGGAPSITWTANDTTLYCAACDTSTTSATTGVVLSFSNTTGSAIDARLTMYLANGGSQAVDFPIPPKVLVKFDASPANLPFTVTGAKVAHDGPPGAVLAEAMVTDSGTGSVRTVRFEAVREIR